MYIQICGSYLPAVFFFGRTSSISRRIQSYVSYIQIYMCTWCSSGANSAWAAAPLHGIPLQCFLLGGAKPLNLRMIHMLRCLEDKLYENDAWERLKYKNTNWLILTHIDSYWLILTHVDLFQVSCKDHFRENQRITSSQRIYESKSAAAAAIGVQWDWRQFLVSLDWNRSTQQWSWTASAIPQTLNMVHTEPLHSSNKSSMPRTHFLLGDEMGLGEGGEGGEGMDPMDPFLLSARLDSSSDTQSMERTAGSLAQCVGQKCGRLQKDRCWEKGSLDTSEYIRISYREIATYIDKIW